MSCLKAITNCCILLFFCTLLFHSCINFCIFHIVKVDNNDTKGVLVKSLSIATTSSTTLCALYVSSAKCLLYKLPIPNCFYLMQSSLQKCYCYSLHVSYTIQSYNVSAKCKFNETNLLNGNSFYAILIIVLKSQKQSQFGQQVRENI